MPPAATGYCWGSHIPLQTRLTPSSPPADAPSSHWVLLGESVQVKCLAESPHDDDVVRVAIWYKDDSKVPIYRCVRRVARLAHGD